MPAQALEHLLVSKAVSGPLCTITNVHGALGPALPRDEHSRCSSELRQPCLGSKSVLSYFNFFFFFLVLCKP